MIVRDHDILTGTPVFAGTRVPVATFIDYIAAGDSIDELLEGFPGVRRDQVIAYLEHPSEASPSG
ncbi:hypothetical protein CKO31_05440 [Thiohalocapsa halophila]|uniref:DUF433 domain-containing protein n=1 Tax=Thiohalocapsa halophila TaxID=69359 RepID=A0ABS1CE81_9GAMM|nr:DUF433 domain-containing protein [Thiohalocapsa halophila]MBK1630195.1 hypothetical protein [Thiohalocapsa halophila]